MTLLEVTIPGVPQGARRHRVQVRGQHVHAFHDDRHAAAEERIRWLATRQWRRPALDEPVLVEIETWHARPGRLRKREHRGTPALPYVGKPDADNVAKLCLDALTKAGVWTDDTRVHELVVRRWWLALDEDGEEVGVPRTVVVVRRVGGEG